MKKNLLIITAVVFSLSSQLKAKNEPLFKEQTPTFLCKKKNKCLHEKDIKYCQICLKCNLKLIKICKSNPLPLPQKGNILSFRRLSYADNELLESHSIKELYDRIRMVDGEDYQKAYMKFGDYKIEFSDSRVVNNELLAKIRIYKNVD